MASALRLGHHAAVVKSMTLAVTCEGHQVTTIEGLSDGGGLHPMQASFIERDAFQCGYRTPGQIMSAVGPDPARWRGRGVATGRRRPRAPAKRRNAAMFKSLTQPIRFGSGDPARDHPETFLSA
jgi:[2Fe-2S] binding domain